MVALGAVIILTLLLFINFRQPTQQAHPLEREAYTQSKHVTDILKSPTNFIQKSGNFILFKTTKNPLASRLSSVTIGAITVLLFYLLANRLFGRLGGSITTMLFMTSSVFLHTARFGDFTVSLFSLFSLFSLLQYLYKNEDHDWLWIVAAISFAWVAYTPGGLIVLIPLIVWKHRWLVSLLKELPLKILIPVGIILLSIVVVVGYSVVRSPEIAKELLGIPSILPSVTDYVKAVLTVPRSLFLAYKPTSTYWLDGQPIFDAIQAFLFVYGSIHILRTPKLERFKILPLILILGSLWVALTGNVLSILIIIPFVYLVIGFGVQAIIFEWRRVFPRNLAVRYAGTVLLGLVLLVSVLFQTYRYFVVWPKTPETKSAFVQK